MEHVEGEWNDFVFRRATSADVDLISALVKEGYFDEEPLTKAMGWSEEYDEDFRKLWKPFLDHNLSFLAIHKETNKPAGLRIIFDHTKDIDWDAFDLRSHQVKNLLILLAAIDEQFSVFEKYGIDRYADLLLTCVSNDFRKRGLVTEMYRRSILLARARGYKVAKACFSSPYSRKAAENAGFKQNACVLVKDLKNAEGGKLIENDEGLMVTQACYEL